MKPKYLCPHCRNAINVKNDIVLRAKNELDQKGIVFLHTELGNYTSKFSADFTIIEGDHVKFSCPICHHNLSNLKNDKLASLVLIDADEAEAKIIFSRIFGEKCTYKIEEAEPEETFGEHWGNYASPDWMLLL